MPTIHGNSIVFHRMVTLVLQVSVLVSAVLFFFYIIPGVEIEFTAGGIIFGISTIYTSIILAFAVSFSTAVVILSWRVWVAYLRPIWNRSNDT